MIAPGRRHIRIACFAAIAVFAMSCQVMPPGLEAIGREFQLNRTLQGLLFAMQFGGFFLTSLGGGWLSDHFGRKRFLVGGFYLTAVGFLIARSAVSYGSLGAAMFLVGCGGGLAETLISLALADLFPERRGQTLNLSQIFYNVGAVITLAGMGLLLGAGGGWRDGYTVAAVAAAACGVWLHLLPIPRASMPAAPDPAGVPQVASNGLVLLLAIGMLMYVGAEMTMSDWGPSFLMDEFNAGETAAAYSLAGYWLAMMFGRMVYVLLVERWSYLLPILVSSLLAALATGVVIVSGGLWVAALGFFAVGLCLAGIWATLLAYAAQRYPKRAGLVFGVIVSFGSAGLILFPPLCGWIADRSPRYRLRAGLSICVVLLLGLAVLAGALWLRDRREGRLRSS